MTDTKITARLRPDVDRRLRAAALLQQARISRVLNDALDAGLPSLREIGALVGGTQPNAEEEPADGDRS